MVVAEHLLQIPSSYPSWQHTLHSLPHPQIKHSSSGGRWNPSFHQTGCSVAWNHLSTVQTLPSGQWHRMMLVSLAPRRRTKAALVLLTEFLPGITGIAHEFKRWLGVPQSLWSLQSGNKIGFHDMWTLNLKSSSALSFEVNACCLPRCIGKRHVCLLHSNSKKKSH